MESRKLKRRAVRENSVVCSPDLWGSQIAPFLERHFVLLTLILVSVACARIISTYTALSLTADEPIHFACGLEYVASHVYRLETQHPPLSRGLQALGPYLAGARPIALPNKEDVGYAEIAGSGNVGRTIILMRLGNLPFFLLACVAVCCWSWHSFGKPVAVVAVAFLTLLPTTLADAGLATTDLALAATVGAAFFAAVLWAETPSLTRSVLLGFFTGLACLAKFTALGYLPAALGFGLAAFLAARWPGWRGLAVLARQRAGMLLLSVGVMAFVIWAGYWFSFGISRLPLTHLDVRVPAPEFLDGIRSAVAHNRAGHGAFLLGEYRTTGWWYYFPVALAVKTPIAFLMLLALGTYLCFRERKKPEYLLPLAFSLGILIPAMQSKIDIGIRHIEPIYLGFSIIAALGFRQLFRWGHTRIVSATTAAALVGWMAISGAVHHPDYLAYFNEFAGKAPQNILVDSNYDWGQDLRLLAKRLHELHATEFSLASSWEAKHDIYLESWYGLPSINRVSDSTPAPGWTVVSSTYDKSSRFSLYGPNMAIPWYDHIGPTERLGPLLLYYTAASTKPDPLEKPGAAQLDQSGGATPH
jgi:hypothetical protein